MSKAKCCPVCGAKPHIVSTTNNVGKRIYQVYCPFAPVNIKTFWRYTEKQAVKMWNEERKFRYVVSQHY